MRMGFIQLALMFMYLQIMNVESFSIPGFSNKSKRNVKATSTTVESVQAKRIPRRANNIGKVTSVKKTNLAKIRASKETTVNVETNHPEPFNLHQYMQLPSSQYSCVPMPLNSSLDRIHGTNDHFTLKVPPIKIQSPAPALQNTFPSVEIRPVLTAQVTVEKEFVSIVSHSCNIDVDGSKWIRDLNINDYFDFQVNIRLTWKESSSSTITADSKIQVDLDPPGAFKMFPNSILEAIGSRAIQMTLGALQKNFMKSLALDYEKWATDETYRNKRKEMEMQLDLRDEMYNGRDVSNGNSAMGASNNRYHQRRLRRDISADETLIAYLKR